MNTLDAVCADCGTAILPTDKFLLRENQVMHAHESVCIARLRAALSESERQFRCKVADVLVHQDRAETAERALSAAQSEAAELRAVLSIFYHESIAHPVTQADRWRARDALNTARTSTTGGGDGN